MDAEPLAAGDVIPHDCQVLEVRVAELRHLFNAIDPSPFRQRDLDPRAEEFILDWSRDLPANAPLALLVHLERAVGQSDEAVVLRAAIHEFFGARAAGMRRRLRDLFRRGRISLAIGLAFLASSIGVGDGLAFYLPDSRWTEVVREGLLIGGWVAMWRPLEIFLYAWWPIRAEARLGDRLSAMPVRIVYSADASSDGWRADWPAAATVGRSSTPCSVPRARSSDTIPPEHRGRS